MTISFVDFWLPDWFSTGYPLVSHVRLAENIFCIVRIFRANNRLALKALITSWSSKVEIRTLTKVIACR